MKKKTKQDDPLLQLQLDWQQHKGRMQSLPFLTDEELRGLYDRVQDKLSEPLPDSVVGAMRRADHYAHTRRFRYAAAICVALLLTGGATALIPTSAALTRSTDSSVSSQYAMATVHSLFNNNNTIA